MKQRWFALIVLIFMGVISSNPIIHASTNQQMIASHSDSIQTLIDNAQPNTTIQLPKGIFYQTFTINKPITIQGQHPETTIINVTSQRNKPAITISSPHVTVKNITVINNGPGLYTTGIRILSENTSISSCHFTKTPIGISIWSNNNTIHHCIFTQCSDEGIVLLSTSFSTAHYNTISSCEFYQNCDAIELQKSCQNTIEYCTMINNTHSGIDAINNNNNNNIIKYCTIENNAVHGIYFSNSQHNIIKQCQINNNKDGNIVTPNSKNITITFQEISTQSNTKQPTSSQSNKNPMQTTNAPLSTRSDQPSILEKIMTVLKSFISFITLLQ